MVELTMGRILSVRFGYNPNSSSLGVDVSFLLFGMGAITLLTPVVATLLRMARAPKASPAATSAQPEV
jgi:hypothetical protein